MGLTGVEVSGTHSHGLGDEVERDAAPADGSHPRRPPPPGQRRYLRAFVGPPGGEAVEAQPVGDFPPEVVVRPAATVSNAAVSPRHGYHLAAPAFERAGLDGFPEDTAA